MQNISVDGIPIMCVNKRVETDRGKCQIAQLYTIPQIFKHRMFYLDWSAIIIISYTYMYIYMAKAYECIDSKGDS